MDHLKSDTPITARTLVTLLEQWLFPVLKRDARRIAALEQRETEREMRLRSVEDRPVGHAGAWCGVYESGVTYAEGALVTRRGVWLALRQTAAEPGSDHLSWKLVLKEKDLR